MTPYERVKLSRERTAGTFPLPNVLDCIRFAICELSEYDDALLRQERTGDKRNNDKAHDPRSELGQALYMLLSAAVQLKYEPDCLPVSCHMGAVSSNVADWYFDAMSYLADLGSEARDIGKSPYAITNVTSIMDEPYSYLYAIADTNGWPVDALINDTCARFEAKHAPQEAR